jgi:hypothetical protein
MVLRDQFHRLAAIARFGDYLEIRLLFEQKFNAGSNDGVVVGQQNADLCQVLSLSMAA